MSSIYIVDIEDGDQDTSILVEDEETAQLYVKMGMYEFYEEIALATCEDLADDILEYYTYLRECGVEEMQLSNEELKKKITKDSDGAIIYD